MFLPIYGMEGQIQMGKLILEIRFTETDERFLIQNPPRNIQEMIEQWRKCDDNTELQDWLLEKGIVLYKQSSSLTV